jgi:DNA polymerase III gamma/tau subunit
MKEASNPGQKTFEALSEQQLLGLLDALLDTDAETLRHKLEQLDRESGRTVTGC